MGTYLNPKNEADLAAAIRLAYFSASKDYRIIRELPTGIGYADIAFIPLPARNKPAIVVELKYNKSAITAINQIKANKYPEALVGFSGEILLVGINYDKDSQKHTCKIERVDNRIG